MEREREMRERERERGERERESRERERERERVFTTLYSIITESLQQQNTFTKLKKGVQKTKAYCNIVVKVNISSTTEQIAPLKHHLYKKLSKSFIIL